MASDKKVSAKPEHPQSVAPSRVEAANVVTETARVVLVHTANGGRLARDVVDVTSGSPANGDALDLDLKGIRWSRVPSSKTRPDATPRWEPVPTAEQAVAAANATLRPSAFSPTR